MAVMCPPLPHSLHSFVCHGEEEENPHTVGAQGAGTSSARSAVIEARLRHRVAFRTCPKEVAPNGVRLRISEPPSRADAAEYLSVAANDVATRTNGEAHQRLNANGHPWEKPPGMHLMECPTVRGSDTSLILLVLADFCPLFGLDTI